MSWPIQVPLAVQWGDMDAFGHVNNARYFTYFETARIALFEKVLLTSETAPTRGPILASVQAQYRQPLHYPAQILACCRVKSVGRTSFVLSHGVVRASDPETIVAEGDGVVVLLDYGTGDKIPVSDAMRAALEALQ